MRLMNVRPYGVGEKNNPKVIGTAGCFLDRAAGGTFLPYFRRDRPRFATSSEIAAGNRSADNFELESIESEGRLFVG